MDYQRGHRIGMVVGLLIVLALFYVAIAGYAEWWPFGPVGRLR